MSKSSVCSGLSWTIFKGPVYAIYSNNEHRKHFMLAVCAAGEDEPAKLMVYEDQEAVNDNKPALQEILFTNVKRIHTRNKDKRINAIYIESKDGHQFSFFTDSRTMSTKWFKYCAVLLTIPCYNIPKLPKDDLGPTESSTAAPQELINQYSGNLQLNTTSCMWVVNILGEGIAKNNVTLTGLCVIIICSSDHTINVHSFKNGKKLLSWHQNAIRRSGCVESLVFLKTNHECSEGAGLLWMKPTISQTVALGQCLQNFLNPKRTNYLQVSSHISVMKFTRTFSPESDSSPESFSASDEDDEVITSRIPPVFSGESNLGATSQCMPTSQVSTTSEYFSESGTLVPTSAGSDNTLKETMTLQSLETYRYKAKPQPLNSTDGNHTRNPPARTTTLVAGSKSDDCSTIWDVMHDEEIQQKALEECHLVLARKLHANILQPLLQQQQLLTVSDSQVLLSDSMSYEEKAKYMVSTLPRKRKGWFQSFLWCLQQSTIGTGHDMIYEALISKHKELRKCVCDDKLDDSVNITKETIYENQQTHSTGDIPAKLDIANLTEMVTPRMSTKWFEMGLQLGVQSTELKRIEHDTKQDSKTACRQMFAEWLGNTKTEKSWKRIMQALRSRSVNESCLANHLAAAAAK